MITAMAAIAFSFAAVLYSAFAQDITYYENETEAAAELRENMKERMILDLQKRTLRILLHHV